MSYSLDVNRSSLRFGPVQRTRSRGQPLFGAVCSRPRTATHHRIFDSPANLTALLALPNVRTVAEQDGFLDAYQRVTANQVIRGNLVPDAQLAAILFQHGVRTLYTRDRDFRKFECFDVRDPFLP
jgi:predicted nucleic acid-binding protein